MKHTLSSDIVLTQPDIDRLVGEIADLDLAQASTQRSIDALLTDREAALDQIRAEYVDALAALANKAKNFEAMRDTKLAIVKSWADSNKETTFGKKRSFTCQRGTIGYKLHKAKLSVVDGQSFELVAVALLRRKEGRAFVENAPGAQEGGGAQSLARSARSL